MSKFTQNLMKPRVNKDTFRNSAYKNKTINTTKALENFKCNKKKPCHKKEFK